MPEFFNVLPPGEALALLLDLLPERPAAGVCVADTSQALGRVVAAEILATESLPPFPRSTMDGYSVRAADTYGASDGLPAWFTLVGEVPMGQGPDFELGICEAAVAYTGGMLAGNADAVVMVEHTQAIDAQTIEVMRPVAPGENVAQPGEDVSAGEPVLPAGHVIRPQDIGALLALGIQRVQVAERPRVGILSMGDEVVHPSATPGTGQVRDVNTYTVAGQVVSAGGTAVPLGLVGDDYEEQLVAARQGLAQSDMLVLSAGSSVSARDRTVDIVAELGEPGPLVHGLALRPGKPAIVGLCDGKPVIGLPGNPVSAMVVSSLLVRPTVYRLMGCAHPPPANEQTAVLTQDIPSAAGREDYVPVRLSESDDGTTIARPVWGKSGFIFTLVKADGLVRVPADAGGVYAGERVQVREL
ncbi:MAG: molybdopterin-binding protein [Chloroflexota bacterium]|nr:molybdopterin-binding protein [Chloroflexota bacterium]MDE2960149.1 molybdopterin-binding protein [Chloroflexota bacterium]